MTRLIFAFRSFRTHIKTCNYFSSSSNYYYYYCCYYYCTAAAIPSSQFTEVANVFQFPTAVLLVTRCSLIALPLPHEFPASIRLLPACNSIWLRHLQYAVLGTCSYTLYCLIHNTQNVLYSHVLCYLEFSSPRLPVDRRQRSSLSDATNLRHISQAGPL
jgi:hypothetical protein